jgi:hypothetical protein
MPGTVMFFKPFPPFHQLVGLYRQDMKRRIRDAILRQVNELERVLVAGIEKVSHKRPSLLKKSFTKLISKRERMVS